MVDVTIDTTGLLVITVEPPLAPPQVLDPIGAPGTPGSTGWSPLYAVVPRVSDSEKVLQLVDWIGGTGTKPVNTINKYVGAAGLVTDIANAAPIRGNATDGTNGTNGTDGEDGAPGAAGSRLYLGTGVPSNGLGVIGDQYVDVSTFRLYDKTGATVWHDNGSFRGQDGANGDDGTDGTDGAGIHFGTGVPTEPGEDEDINIDTDTWNIYQYDLSDNEWTLKGNIKGAPGNDGADGSDGTDGTNGTDGDDGAPGAKGASVLFGASDPTDDMGADEDSFVNTASFDYFTKSAGHWSLAGSLKGADGTDGTNGTDGEDGAPGAKGDKGDPGEKGDKGDDGEDGTDGTNGTDGVDAINAADMFMFFPGKLVSNTQLVARLNIVRAFNWPTNLAGSIFDCANVPAADCDFTIQNNGAPIGTISFTAATAAATCTCTATAFVAGDLIEVIGPLVKDDDIANISFTILGSR